MTPLMRTMRTMRTTIVLAAWAWASAGCGGDDGGDDGGGGDRDAGGADAGVEDAGRDDAGGIDAGSGGDDAGPPMMDAGPLPCPEWDDAVVRGTVAETEVREASGLVTSRRTPGVLWMHNDSGDSARVFAIGEDGAALGTFTVRGASANDWEDIAIGPGPTAGSGYLYVGDIGDNAEARADVRIYRFEEPAVDPGAPADGMVDAETMIVRYPDRAHNAEALLHDPIDGALYIVQKTSGGTARLFLVGPFVAGMVTAEELALVDLPIVTGGDVAADGSLIVLKNYVTVRVWRRAPGTSLADALRFGTMFCPAPIADEAQGEAIAFALDGSGYWTVSEGRGPALNYFARR